MSKCKKVNISNKARMELHDALSLTGAEISINTLPAGECVPFVHCHKNNEEIYGIISGSGKVIIDGDEVQLIASINESITFVCVQVKENSLETFTMSDAEVIQ